MLLGVNVPYLLRPQNGSFEIIGECFVVGIVHAEFLREKRVAEIGMELFPLNQLKKAGSDFIGRQLEKVRYVCQFSMEDVCGMPCEEWGKGNGVKSGGDIYAKATSRAMVASTTKACVCPTLSATPLSTHHSPLATP